MIALLSSWFSSHLFLFFHDNIKHFLCLFPFFLEMDNILITYVLWSSYFAKHRENIMARFVFSKPLSAVNTKCCFCLWRPQSWLEPNMTEYIPTFDMIFEMHSKVCFRFLFLMMSRIQKREAFERRPSRGEQCQGPVLRRWCLAPKTRIKNVSNTYIILPTYGQRCFL